MNRKNIKIILVLILSIMLLSCNSDSASSDTYDYDKLYVTLQSTHKVAILNAHTLELIEEVDIDIGSMMPPPHYVVLDEENGYWFISARSESR